MDPTLSRYLRAHYVQRPEAVCPVKDIVRGYLESLPADQARAWNRTRVLAELSAAGFAVGNIGRVALIVGLEPRGTRWRVTNGQLTHA